MSEISSTALFGLVKSALAGQNITEDDAAAIAEEFVVAEYFGKKTHGVGKLISMNLGDVSAVPTEERIGGIVSVDGNRSNGFILFRRLAERASRIAAENGIAVVTARNFSRYSALYPYTEIIAENAAIGILMNSAGPSAVAPYGSIDAITGTNPLAFSFPADDGIQTFDFSTSSVVWGAIRQAALEGRRLPGGAFIDVNGLPTTEPGSVSAVSAFGEAKGWALNLAIELLSAAAGGSVGKKVASEFDLGAVLIALNPAAMGAGSSFAVVARGLLSEIRNSRPAAGVERVRVPGDSLRTEGNIEQILSSTAFFEVPDVILDHLRRMADGEKISDFAANRLFN